MVPEEASPGQDGFKDIFGPGRGSSRPASERDGHPPQSVLLSEHALGRAVQAPTSGGALEGSFLVAFILILWLGVMAAFGLPLLAFLLPHVEGLVRSLQSAL